MKFKCTIPGNPDLVVGRMYHVARIHEFPEHQMVKKSASDDWPNPGDPLFGIHAEDSFEIETNDIEVVSCKCKHCHSEYFGAVVSRSVDVRKVNRFDHVPEPCDDDLNDLSYRDWVKIANGIEYPRKWHTFLISNHPLYWEVHRNIVFPRDPKVFWEVGIQYRTMVERNMTRGEAEIQVLQFLRMIEISHLPIGMIELDHWERQY